MPDVTLVKVGDKQLWLLTVENSVLPAFVQLFEDEKGDRFWGVYPAIEMLYPAHQKFNEVLKVRAVATGGEYLFFKSLNAIREILTKADGVTPSYYYTWKGDRVFEDSEDSSISSNIEKNDFPSVLDDVFLREVVTRTQICSLASMRVIWAAIVQVMMQMLITHRRPVNLGFATIFAVPYRVNWKSILMGAFPNSYRCFTKPKRSQPDELQKAGITRALRYKELLSIDQKKHFCNWALEFVPNEAWDSTCEAVELKRMLSGKTKYAKFIARSIIKSQTLIQSAYRYFICNAIKPSAEFSKVAATGTQILIPFTPKGGISPKAAKRSCTDICADATDSEEEPCLVSAIEREVDEMSSVQDIQQGPAELRISGGTISRSRYGED